MYVSELLKLEEAQETALEGGVVHHPVSLHRHLKSV